MQELLKLQYNSTNPLSDYKNLIILNISHLNIGGHYIYSSPKKRLTFSRIMNMILCILLVYFFSICHKLNLQPPFSISAIFTILILYNIVFVFFPIQTFTLQSYALRKLFWSDSRKFTLIFYSSHFEIQYCNGKYSYRYCDLNFIVENETTIKFNKNIFINKANLSDYEVSTLHDILTTNCGSNYHVLNF